MAQKLELECLILCFAIEALEFVVLVEQQVSLVEP